MVHTVKRTMQAEISDDVGHAYDKWQNSRGALGAGDLITVPNFCYFIQVGASVTAICIINLC